MNELPCEVVRDLLPSYVDGLTSETTNGLLAEHLEGCEPCRAALDAMRAPGTEPEPAEGNEKEIDYLKKHRRHNRAVVLWCLVGALLAAIAVGLLRLFVVGEPLSEGAAAIMELEVSEDRTVCTLGMMSLDSAKTIIRVNTEEAGGVVRLEPRAVLSSPLHRGDYSYTVSSAEPIRRICVGERIVWDDGARVSVLASNIFATRHAYVGEMPANNRTAAALGVSDILGAYTSELHTSERPYVWTLTLSEDIPKDDSINDWRRRRDAMSAFARVLLATIENLDEVRFVYTVNGVPAEMSMTVKRASSSFGQDIKNCYESPRLLDELIEKTGLQYLR